MKCPKCGSEDKVKNGRVNDGFQRYRCKNCGCNYTKEGRGYPKELRLLALRMYLEGIGFRGIGRLLKVSNVTVLNWVKEAGRKLIDLKSDEPKHVHMLEIDEMHSYIQKKTMSSGCGWLLIELPERSLGSGSVVVELKR